MNNSMPTRGGMPVFGGEGEGMAVLLTNPSPPHISSTEAEQEALPSCSEGLVLTR